MFKVTVATLAVMAIQDVASAQTVPPNFGNYQALTGNFRIGAQAFNPATGETRELAFERTSIEDIIDFVDPFEIQQTLGTFYTDQTRISQVLDLRGATVLAGFDQNSPVLTVRFVNPATGQTVIDRSGASCSFVYAGVDRDDSFAQLDDATSDSSSPTSQLLLRCLTRSLASFSPIDPLAGNPFSLMGSMARSALDLTDSGSLVEDGAQANTAGDPWIVGASYSGGTADRFSLSRIDARVAKGWRVFEGNRARLKLDMPFSYARVQGSAAYTGQIGIGLEMPLKDRVWSIEPRVSYGIALSPEQGSAGHILQATVTSLVAINNIGRGRLIIGNMAGYATTLNTPGVNVNPELKKFVFRNGLAYELPLKMRIANRGTSLRGSYTFTNFSGERLYNNSFHELTLSFGLRGREDTPKALRDVFRVNLSTIQAQGFSSFSAGVGFKF